MQQNFQNFSSLSFFTLNFISLGFLSNFSEYSL
jgi:hypothetical protein